jgi:non-heme chloroperoxidase
MKNVMLWLITLIALSAGALHAQESTDSSPHTVQFVTVDKDVRLEVLDWGGKGTPMIFLAGMGNSAHSFDGFAPKFIAKYHVYGITRRGWGASSKPAPTIANYAADRLGDDVLTVIDALRLNRPIVAGHSIAGEELSSIGSRHPEKVSALIYLDAGDAYGFYDRAHGNSQLDMIDLRKRIDDLQAGAVLSPEFVQSMAASVSQLQKSLEVLRERLDRMPGPPPPAPPPIAIATFFGEQKYTEIHGPVLALFACPHNFDRMFPNDPAGKAAIVADDLASCTAQSKAFAAGVPTAHVVRIPNADHYVFNSNEADVIREMNEFLAKLP